MDKQQLEQNIKNMEAEIAKMKAELNKPEKFEFKYAGESTFIFTGTRIFPSRDAYDNECLDHYRYRISETNAEAEVLRNKQANFIGALFEQIDVDYAEGINWSERNQAKYYITYCTNAKEWDLCSSFLCATPGVVYASKEVVFQAIRLLNSGQVECPKE